MLKKLLGIFATLMVAVLYALNIKQKPKSETMAEKSLARFDNLGTDDKLAVLERIVKRK